MSTPQKAFRTIKKRQVRIRRCQIIVYLHLREEHGQNLELQDGANRTTVGMIFKKEFRRFYFVYLFVRDIERGRDIGKGRSRLPAGSLVQDAILGPRNHNLSRRQMLNQ